MNGLRFVVAAAALAASAIPALAQDYTSTMLTMGNQYTAPPGGAGQTTLSVVGAAGGPGGQFVTLPFEFPYCGVKYSKVWVSSQGFIQFGVTGTSGSVAYANTTWPPTAVAEDGMVAAMWDDLNMDRTAGGNGNCLAWTIGTAPNRTWVVSWEGVPHFSSATSSLTFQIQLSETSGRILLAYKSGSSWQGLSYSAGMDAVNGSAGDGRSYNGGVVTRGFPFFDTVFTNSANLSGTPPRDVRFDPRQVTYTGTLVYDRLNVGSGGIGATVTSGVPLSGLSVELRRSDNSLGFSTTTDANGAFSVTGIGLDSSKTGSLAVVAQNASCAVRPSAASAPHAWTVQTGLAFNANVALGTRTLGAAADASGATRAPLHMALVLQSTYDWVRARRSVTLTPLDVIYAVASASPTSYTYSIPSTSTPAQLVVGSAGTANHDAWDDWILRRAYARHVLTAFTGPISRATDMRFDASTDEENAFAEAFGTYLHSAITRQSTTWDGINASSATSFDLEAPTFSAPKGITSASRIAAAFWDLVDTANETTDSIDGTGTAGDLPLTVTSQLTTPVNASTFLQQWITAGQSALPASRVWIANGVFSDDTFESNDASTEPGDAGDVPVQTANLVLNVGNEDWFTFDNLTAATPLAVEVHFDRTTYRTGIALTVLNSVGTTIATGTPVGTTGPIRATTANLAVGTYTVRVRHTSGPSIPAYTLQVARPAQFLTNQVTGWTVGRPITIQYTASGGLAPYTFAVADPGTLPAGLTFDSGTLRVTGTPTAVGDSTVAVQMTDAFVPPHVVVAGGAFRVNDVVDVAPGTFTPFALNRSHSRVLPVGGGTLPMTVNLTGTLPDGVTVNQGTMTFEGTPTVAGSSAYRLDVTDVAGSNDASDGRAVVCVPVSGVTTADLAEGDAAAGWFFDAVEGSTVTVKVATAKGAPVRTLTIAAIGPDGKAVAGAVAKGGAGKGTVTKMRCARSGRYFIVIASKTGAATQALATIRAVAPAKGAGKLGALEASSTFDVRIGALAGGVLRLKATPDKPSGAKLGIAYLEAPDGSLFDLGAATIKETGGAVQLDATLNMAGTWRAIVVCRPSKAAKKVTWSFTVKQPIAGTFDAGDDE